MKYTKSRRTKKINGTDYEKSSAQLKSWYKIFYLMILRVEKSFSL